MVFECRKKKTYDTPFAEIELFTVSDIIATSGGQGRFDDEIDVNSVDTMVIDSNTGEVKYYLDQNEEVLDKEDVESIF